MTKLVWYQCKKCGYINSDSPNKCHHCDGTELIEMSEGKSYECPLGHIFYDNYLSHYDSHTRKRYKFSWIKCKECTRNKSDNNDRYCEVNYYRDKPIQENNGIVEKLCALPENYHEII